MLTETERESALNIIMRPDDPNDFEAINTKLCERFPKIEVPDLISLWREAAERQKAEAEELERFAAARPLPPAAA